MWRFRNNSKLAPGKKGQAVIEYVLLLICLSILSAGFTKFVGENLFSAGLQKDRLPKKVSNCLSHGKGLQCQ